MRPKLSFATFGPPRHAQKRPADGKTPHAPVRRPRAVYFPAMSTETASPLWRPVWPRLATGLRESQRMRLATMTRLRWMSVAGQAAACVFVAWGLWFPYPVGACLGLIALSASLNLFLSQRFAKTHRLSSRRAALVLAFDIVQPASLMFLTGGIANPFAIFLIMPAIVAAATQPPATVVALSGLAIALASVLAFVHLPVPWAPGTELALPALYVGGMWFAIVTSIAFATFYVYRVAAESRALADALTATELALQREQHLSALDGLAAAAAHELGTPLATIALVAREMERAVPADDPAHDDVQLLVTQSARCREILARLASLSSSSEEHMARLPLSSLVDQVVAPHLGFGVDVEARIAGREGEEPILRRNAGIVYGLGNIVENAVDFARARVAIETQWDDRTIRILVRDDGRGFSADALSRIGDPYMSRRERREAGSGGNLGLGLFIAKTLLERSGARLSFRNTGRSGGAEVEIEWPRDAFPSLEATGVSMEHPAVETGRHREDDLSDWNGALPER